MKRMATSNLNRDNWDAEEEEEDKGTFKVANENELKKRVIKTARRQLNRSSTDTSASLFSGLSGFSSDNAKGKESFAFLSKINPINTAESSNYSSQQYETKTSDNKVSMCTKTNLTDVSDSSDNTFTKTDSIEGSDKSNKNKDELEKPSEIKLEDLSAEDLYFYKLKCLNYTFTEWVLKYVNENVNYVFTPIFADYEKHLKLLREERRQSELLEQSKLSNLKSGIANEQNTIANTNSPLSNKSKTESKCDDDNIDKNVDKKENMFRFANTFDKDKKFTLTTSFSDKSDKYVSDEQTKPFVFNALLKTDTTVNTFPKNNIQFDTVAETGGITQSNSSFSFMPKSNLFTFPTTLVKSSDETDKNEKGLLHENLGTNEDSSGDGEITTPSNIVTEDGSVYSKRCKVFIKKESKYQDRGIGIMFVKLVNERKKCQIIVRSDNSLGNIIINCLLTENIPLQKIGKNNVMLICCPTPDMPPTSVLLKVRTSEEVDELIDTLNKFRK